MSAQEPLGEGLEDLLHCIGIEDIRPQGDEIMGRCPAHERRTGFREMRPRHFSVNVTTGRMHCFSCEYGGSLIKLVMDQTNLGLWEATRLIHDHRIEFDRRQGDEGEWDPDDWVTYTDDQGRDTYVHRDSVEFITDIRQTFDAEFLTAIPRRVLEKRGITQASCEEYEIRYDDALPGWVLPFKDGEGTLYGWEVKPNYSRNPWVEPLGVKKSRFLFGFDRLDSTRVILVESPLDVVYLRSLGFGFSAVAAYGCNVSDTQLALIEDADVLSIVVALDNDAAGRKGTQSILDRGWHKRIPSYLFDYGDAAGKDPGELSRAEIERGLAEARLVPRRRG